MLCLAFATGQVSVAESHLIATWESDASKGTEIASYQAKGGLLAVSNSKDSRIYLLSVTDQTWLRHLRTLNLKLASGQQLNIYRTAPK